MNHQTSLFEEAPRLVALDRLFFGVMPDAGAVLKISECRARLCSEQELLGRPIKDDRVHSTLLHIGDYEGVPQGILRDARTAAATLSLAPFEVSFDRARSFMGKPGNNPFVLRGGDGLVALKKIQHALSLAMIRHAVPCASLPDQLHMTLLYDSVIVPELGIDPVAWMVREFVLVHSEIGRTRYNILGRWALQG